MILEGYVTDKNKSPIANAIVEVKGNNFVTLFSAESNNEGYYKLDIPTGKYPFLTAVKDYGTNYLEIVLTYNYKDGSQTLTLQEIESALSSHLTSLCPPKRKAPRERCFFVFGMALTGGGESKGACKKTVRGTVFPRHRSVRRRATPLASTKTKSTA